MIRWILELLTDDQFQIPEGYEQLPACVVRPFRTEDTDRCLEVYRLNESHHYPVGLYDDFKASLQDPERLVLVVENSGEVIGCGAVCMDPNLSQAIISFGIIHPEHQRRRFGTVLLLSRLAALPEPLDSWIISLTTAGPSASFYQRFGFLRGGRAKLPRVQIHVDFYRTYLFHKGWKSCLRCLSDSQVINQFSGVAVPTVDFREMAERYASG